MFLMSPLKDGKPHSTGLNQLDIETGKIVTELKFEKDGADITMRDITNDTKGSQLDPSESTFLGLDDNRLCQWICVIRKGWFRISQIRWCCVGLGHPFSRGTNFQCFASTGDGSVVFASLDGKIGSPITHFDVTYDGKWVLGTADTYLILKWVVGWGIKFQLQDC